MGGRCVCLALVARARCGETQSLTLGEYVARAALRGDDLLGALRSKRVLELGAGLLSKRRCAKGHSFVLLLGAHQQDPALLERLRRRALRRHRAALDRVRASRRLRDSHRLADSGVHLRARSQRARQRTDRQRALSRHTYILFFSARGRGVGWAPKTPLSLLATRHIYYRHTRAQRIKKRLKSAWLSCRVKEPFFFFATQADGIAGSLRVRRLLWGAAGADSDCDVAGEFDLVIVADCIYQPQSHEALVETIRASLAVDGRCLVVFALHGNAADDEVLGFFQHARRRGLDSRRVESCQLDLNESMRDRCFIADDEKGRKRSLVHIHMLTHAAYERK